MTAPPAYIIHWNASLEVPIAAIGGDLNIQCLKGQPLPIEIKSFTLSGHLGAVGL